MAYPGFRRRQLAWVFCRRDIWHSGFPQACWRFPTRGSGRNHRRQIAHGLFRASGMVMLHGHHASARTVGGSDQSAWVSFGKQGIVTSRKRRRTAFWERPPSSTGRQAGDPRASSGRSCSLSTKPRRRSRSGSEKPSKTDGADPRGARQERWRRSVTVGASAESRIRTSRYRGQSSGRR